MEPAELPVVSTESSRTTSAPPHRRRPPLAWWVAGLLTVFLLLFAQTTRFAFVWDDVPEVAENPLLHGPLVDGLFAPQSAQYGLAVNEDALLRPRYDSFRPLRYLSYRLDGALHGLAPAGMHLQSVCWAALALLLVFWLAQAWLENTNAALAVTAAFACHPMNVECVAYVSARSDLLAGVFALASATLVVRAMRRESPARVVPSYLFAGVFYLCSLASKESNVALPVVLALFALSRGCLRAHLRPLSALALVAVGWFVLRGQLLEGSGRGTPLPALQVLGAMVFQYVGAYLVPVDCSIVRPLSTLLPWSGTALLAALGLLLLTAVRRDPAGLGARLLPAVAWTVLLLAPSALAAEMHATASDRYFYLPSIGLGLAIAELALRQTARAQRLIAAACACWGLACLGLSFAQVRTWENELTLYLHAVTVEPASTRAHYGVGLALARQGGCEPAVPYFERAAALDPRNTRAWTNLGVCQLRLGDPLAARAALTEGLRSCDGLYAPTWHNLAALEFASGNLAEGCAAERRALTLQPSNGAVRQAFDAHCAPPQPN